MKINDKIKENKFFFCFIKNLQFKNFLKFLLNI